MSRGDVTKPFVLEGEVRQEELSYLFLWHLVSLFVHMALSSIVCSYGTHFHSWLLCHSVPDKAILSPRQIGVVTSRD